VAVCAQAAAGTPRIAATAADTFALYFILCSPSLRPSQKWQTRMQMPTRLQYNRAKFSS